MHKKRVFNSNKQKGFTLMELLVVIAIISILASIILSSVNRAKEKAYFSRAKLEFKSMNTALALYFEDNQDYPPRC